MDNNNSQSGFKLAGDNQPADVTPQMGQPMGGMNPQMGQPMGGMNPQMEQPMGGMNPQIGQPMGGMNPQMGQPMGGMNSQMGQPMGGMNPQMGQPMGGMNPQMGQPMGGMNPQMGQPMGGMNPQMGRPMSPQGGSKPPKKTGKIIGIIGGAVAAVALVVCGIIFIPRIFSHPEEDVKEAMSATFKSDSDTYFDSVFGDTLNTYAKNGGTVTGSLSLDSVEGSSANGIGVSLTQNLDMSGEKMNADLALTSNGTEIIDMQMYSDSDNTYWGIEDAMSAYLVIPNEFNTDDLTYSVFGQALGLSNTDIPSTDIDISSMYDVASVTDASSISSELPELTPEYKSKGNKKVDVNGDSVKTKAYTATYKEEDIEDWIIEVVDLAMSNEAVIESMGVDAATLDTYMTQIESLIPSIVPGDIVANIYVKDGKVVKIETSDDFDIMGVSGEYSFELDIVDDMVYGSFEIEVDGSSVIAEFEVGSKEDNGVCSTYLDVTFNAGGSEFMKIYAGIDVTEADNTFSATASIDNEDFSSVSVNANGSFQNVVKDASFEVVIDSFSIVSDGDTMIEGSGSYSIDASTPSVASYDSSFVTYNLFDMSEEDLTTLITDNADQIMAWVQEVDTVLVDLGLVESDVINNFGGLGGIGEPDDPLQPATGTDANAGGSDTISYDGYTITVSNTLPGYTIDDSSYDSEYYLYINGADGSSGTYENGSSDYYGIAQARDDFYFSDGSVVVEEAYNEEHEVNGETVYCSYLISQNGSYVESSVEMYKEIGDGEILLLDISSYDSVLNPTELVKLLSSEYVTVVQD